jgi:hypothetical protein
MERIPLIDSWSNRGKQIETLEQGHLEFKDVHFRYPTRYFTLPAQTNETSCARVEGPQF